MAGLYYSVCAAGLACNDIHELAFLRTPLHKLHNAITLGEEGMVLAATHIFTRMKTRSALTDQYITSQHILTTVAFYTESCG